MKPSAKQLQLLEVLSRHIKYWERTNDITSPTHTGDLDQDLQMLLNDVIITKVEKNIIYHNMVLLWVSINKIDDTNTKKENIDVK